MRWLPFVQRHNRRYVRLRPSGAAPVVGADPNPLTVARAAEGSPATRFLPADITFRSGCSTGKEYIQAFWDRRRPWWVNRNWAEPPVSQYPPVPRLPFGALPGTRPPR